jgi:hypothetical protein
MADRYRSSSGNSIFGEISEKITKNLGKTTVLIIMTSISYHAERLVIDIPAFPVI